MTSHVWSACVPLTLASMGLTGMPTVRRQRRMIWERGALSSSPTILSYEGHSQ